ncbi:hypothetical protein [Methylobacterium sp. GC_Met_2]|uniref:hypothetical protein n=1 Tax=Methylobacterium sp. GC_Met_2 TaxID=2937376 RepID=UPI00226B068B|nr:hypothetical protein [Methylobacterium sp. GC_Met_2]
MNGGETGEDRLVRKYDKIQLHLTKSSTTLNGIHSTFEAENGSKSECMAYTDAVKTKSGLYLVQARQCPNLNRDYFKPQDTDRASTKIVPVGNYNPEIQTLHYALLVSHPERSFDASKASQIQSVSSYVFSQFRLTVIASAANNPSTDFGSSIKFLTAPAEAATKDSAKELFKRQQYGRNEAQCARDVAAAFNWNSAYQLKNIINNMRKTEFYQQAVDLFTPRLRWYRQQYDRYAQDIGQDPLLVLCALPSMHPISQ